MNFDLPVNLHGIASMASERIIFSLGTGTLLALVVWAMLRMVPRKDARTNFAVWFATLLTTALLPLLSSYFAGAARTDVPAKALITISAQWATYIFLAWAMIALIGLARVTLALWQVQRLRRGSRAVDLTGLDPELKTLVEEFRKSRSLTLLVSQRLEVPTAIGFFRPAVVLPEWLLQETPADELKYIVLHELAHLRRRDDWTNLTQQVVKALLFFVPSVWWIERKLQLEREMACDDAVLAQSGTPRGYAECLAHVAQRSFVRRQLALAQAAVSRAWHLTLRVTKILDPDRPQQVKMWKPAIPVVIVVAGLCVFSASRAPSLVGFADEETENNALPVQPVVTGPAKAMAVNFSRERSEARPNVVEAALKTSAQKPGASVGSASVERNSVARALVRKRAVRKPGAVPSLRATVESERQFQLANLQRPPQAAEYVTIREEFVMVVTQRTESETPESWQMHVVQVSVMPVKSAQKQVPRKI